MKIVFIKLRKKVSKSVLKVVELQVNATWLRKGYIKLKTKIDVGVKECFDTMEAKFQISISSRWVLSIN